MPSVDDGIAYWLDLLGFRDWFGCGVEVGAGHDSFVEGEGKLLLGLAVAVVGADDALDERVTDDVDVFKVTEADTFDAVEDVQGLEQAGLFGVGQIGLGEVAGDDRLGVSAEASDEHLHLLHGGVLGLVHDDEGIVEGAATHEGERGYFDHVALEELIYFFLVEEVVESVVERAEIGVDLFLQTAGKEAEAFPCFDRGANEDDAADFFCHESGDGHGYGEVGFASASRTKAEGHIGLLDGFDVLALVGGAGLDRAFDAGGALFAGVDQAPEGRGRIRDKKLQHAVEFAIMQVDAGFAEVVEVGEDAFDARDIAGFAGHMDGVGAEIDGDVEFVLEEAEVFVAGPVQGLNANGDFQGFFDQVVC